MEKGVLKSHENVTFNAIFSLHIVSFKIFRIFSSFRTENLCFYKQNDAKNTFFRFEAKKFLLLFASFRLEAKRSAHLSLAALQKFMLPSFSHRLCRLFIKRLS